jgi:hypothetical protein
MVGKSMDGSGATGRKRKATAPERKIARVIKVVATGRLIKGAEKFEEKFMSLGPGYG